MSDTDSFDALKKADNTRRQILNAAMICIMSLGPARTNISSIASQAGVSRPTVYAHFERLEDIIQEAITTGTDLLVDALEAHAAKFASPRERVVEAFLHLLGLSEQVDVLSKPMSFDIASSPRDVIPPEGITAARRALAHMLEEEDIETQATNERAETAVRLFLSLAAFRHSDDLRGYIERAALPAMGL